MYCFLGSTYIAPAKSIQNIIHVCFLKVLKAALPSAKAYLADTLQKSGLFWFQQIKNNDCFSVLSIKVE